jgi:hypothetical protein
VQATDQPITDLPDQHVAHVLPLNDFEGLSAFFGAFMVDSNLSWTEQRCGLQILAHRFDY